ncbi:MAG: hypothetical protein JWL83_2367 [Actinomycetia bacterium]|nr:hypothetical protein [Actinomycetes bacterium]
MKRNVPENGTQAPAESTDNTGKAYVRPPQADPVGAWHGNC